MSSRKGKNTRKENREKDKGELLWDSQSLREKGKGKKKSREKKEKEELLEIGRVWEKRVKEKK